VLAFHDLNVGSPTDYEWSVNSSLVLSLNEMSTQGETRDERSIEVLGPDSTSRLRRFVGRTRAFQLSGPDEVSSA
jgi:hypothetical protein